MNLTCIQRPNQIQVSSSLAQTLTISLEDGFPRGILLDSTDEPLDDIVALRIVFLEVKAATPVTLELEVLGCEKGNLLLDVYSEHLGL